MVDYIKYSIDRKGTPVNIYIDLSKAFDTLNFDILLYKLQYYGIRDIALKLLKSYISNRKQYVKYNVNESGFTEIKTGVPQGSILGPLLFYTQMSHILNIVPIGMIKMHFFIIIITPIERSFSARP